MHPASPPTRMRSGETTAASPSEGEPATCRHPLHWDRRLVGCVTQARRFIYIVDTCRDDVPPYLPVRGAIAIASNLRKRSSRMVFKTANSISQRYGVANRLEKRALLIAVNLVAGLSIFFFGRDDVTECGVLDRLRSRQAVTVPAGSL
ncbi:hypothetical protein LTR53_013449 [Teratosphaeriaceae sp. CCFEE 6253]|nr:hypothetical protein LTR53_013449 [Teratosphaeriaceae sp. CCFEE 6253]